MKRCTQEAARIVGMLLDNELPPSGLNRRGRRDLSNKLAADTNFDDHSTLLQAGDEYLRKRDPVRHGMLTRERERKRYLQSLRQQHGTQ